MIGSPETCRGFVWVGQSFAYCDGCGHPYWEHDFIQVLSGNPFTGTVERTPISADAKAAVKARWGKE